MRSFKLGLAATAVICALSATAQADCVKVEALGEAVTHDIAYVFATHGLANVIYGKGRVGKGPVHTTCRDGSGYNDMSLLADGVQRDGTSHLLGRLALPSHVTPMVGANENSATWEEGFRSAAARV